MSRHIYAVKDDDGKLVLFTRVDDAKEYASLSVAPSVWEKFDAWFYTSGFLECVKDGHDIKRSDFVHHYTNSEPWTLLSKAEWRSTMKPPKWFTDIQKGQAA